MAEGAFAGDAMAKEKSAVIDFVAIRVVGYGTAGPLVIACFAAGTGKVLATSTRRLRKRDLHDLGDDCATATVVDD